MTQNTITIINCKILSIRDVIYNIPLITAYVCGKTVLSSANNFTSAYTHKFYHAIKESALLLPLHL